LLDLSTDLPIFVGFKLDTSLRRQIESLSGANRKYVSADDSTFLRLCRVGESLYVGKLIHERLSTDRVDDIKRNVLSIMARICPETRFPHHLEILAVATEAGTRLVIEDETRL